MVFECSGKERGLLSALSLAAPHGEVFLIGAAWQRDPGVAAADIVRPVFNKYLALRSGWEWQLPRHAAHGAESVTRCTSWVLDCMREGSVQVADLITDRIAPAGVPQAYADLLDHPAGHLGVVIDWQHVPGGASDNSGAV